jgi:hypothetical protein
LAGFLFSDPIALTHIKRLIRSRPRRRDRYRRVPWIRLRHGKAGATMRALVCIQQRLLGYQAAATG